MLNFFKITILFSLMVLLSACGGGGGSSSGNGSSSTQPPTTTTPPTTTPPATSTALTANLTSAVFEARQYQPSPPPIDITLTASGDDVAQLIAGFAPGVAEPEWLGVDLIGTANSATLSLSILTTDISNGSYSVPLRVLTATATDEVIDTLDILVSLEMERGKILIVNPNEIRVTTTPGQQPVVETVTLSTAGMKEGEVINWDRVFDGVVGEDLVTLNPPSGVLADGETQDVEITYTPFGSGVDSSTFFTINFGVDDDARSGALSFRASSQDGLFSRPNEANFVFEQGVTTTRTESLTLNTARGGEPTQTNWTATVDQSWATVAQSGASTLDITVDPTTLAVGEHEALISVSHEISNQILEIPVIVIVSGPVVTVSQKGVALSNLSSLLSQIEVSDSDGNPVPWTASTTASWLDVTVSGAAGTAVGLTANTDGLAANTLQLAEVVISNTTLPDEETVQVGLWVGNDIETRVSFNVGPDFALPRDGQHIVADPVRPYVYVKTDALDAVRMTYLSTYNVYTGEQVGETMLVDMDANGDMTISDDGTALYIIGDNSTSFDGRDLAIIDLSDMNARVIPLSDSLRSSEVAFARVKSQGVLISSRGVVVDTETEEVVNVIASDNGTSSMRVSQNGTVRCVAFEAGLGGEFECGALTGSGIIGAPISSTPIATSTITAGSFRLGSVFGLSNDGENLIFRANADSRPELRSVKLADEAVNFILPNLNSDDFIIDQSNNIVMATDDGSRFLTVEKYDQDAVLIASDAFSEGDFSEGAEDILLSGDQSRVIQLQGQELYIMPTPEN